LARPISNLRSNLEQADVVDIMLAVDVSGSMTQEDFIVDHRLRDRLYVTKLAVYDFIESRKKEGELLGTDRVGLLLYAKYAWLQCPLTLDHDILLKELERVTIDKNDEKHSRTAIGSAIGLAVSKLIKSEADSKVVILLTDGLNNEGNLDPVTAAQLAQDYGIRIYTIGAGATESRGSGFGALLGTVGARNNPIDEDAMRRIADITGGKYYRATDADTLQEAYREIDELERTKVEVGETFSFDDRFLPYALLGAMLMGASVFGRRQWYEPIP
jgi:Ca-activated chloride channel family protein